MLLYSLTPCTVRAGATPTLASVLTIVTIGEFYIDRDLALNIVGAVALSLMMAATYAGAMRAQFTRLRDEALHDPLTALPNRHALETALSERLEAPYGQFASSSWTSTISKG